MKRYNYWEDKNSTLAKGLRDGLSEADIIINICEDFSWLLGEFNNISRERNLGTVADIVIKDKKP